MNNYDEDDDYYSQSNEPCPMWIKVGMAMYAVGMIAVYVWMFL
jgi:hypothetical protein